jgi:hypothetical protein
MNKIAFLKLLMIFTCATFLLPMNLNAAEIGEGDFVSPTVFNYNGLGLPGDNSTPITIYSHTHTTDDGDLRYLNFGPGYGLDGECVASNTNTGFIDIVLDSPVLMAGGRVSGSTGNIQFFDIDDNLLGTVTISSNPSFAGWDSEGGNISRIRINDTQSNGIIIMFDDLTIEGDGSIEPTETAIPTINEWGMILFMFLAGVASVYYLRRQENQ